jgi:hypothetical protein
MLPERIGADLGWQVSPPTNHSVSPLAMEYAVLVGAGGDDLGRAGGRLVDEGSGVAVDHIAGGLPGDFAGGGVDGDDERVGVSIHNQNNFAGGIDG